MTPMNVAVFGAGYVGLVSAAGLAAIGHNVVCVDIDREKIGSLNKGQIPFFEPGLSELVTQCIADLRLTFTDSLPDAVAHGDVLIIGVGTPPLSSGAADTSQVLAAAHAIGVNLQRFATVVVKSTVPVGTSVQVAHAVQAGIEQSGSRIQFAVASNPEFLKEGDAVRDFMEPDRIVVGASDERAIQMLTQLYEPLCTHENALMVMNEQSSELCKYASNAMLATRISFMNEMAKLSDAVGADISQITRVMAADARIGSKYLNAGAGFGGSCFPKDLRAIVAMGNELGCDLDVIRSVIAVNDSQQEVVISKARQLVGSLKGKRCAVWGLSFKPETDDIREAPAVALIHALLAEGATVCAHDPLVKWLPMYSSLPTEIFTITDSPYEATLDSDVLFLMTEWSDYAAIDPLKLANEMREANVVDGRNLWRSVDFSETSVKYVGIGRQSNNIFFEIEQLKKLVS
ncbi:MAG: UDP-glucose/GDP-mannose dehydrogenase family protein [Actinobacteria bacterium]|nr:UDP-glucose/GDP-mannose dehydrogenase family protein [Actinomycetota bacterium]